VSADEPLVSIRDLRVWYGTPRGPVRAVDGVSLDLRAGETVALVGESGCGKSTLGRSLLGLLAPGASVAGAIRYRGEELTAARPRRLRQLRGNEIGLVFQEPMTRLDPLMRVSDHFSEVLHAHVTNLSRRDVRARSLEALRRVGIPPTRFDQYPHEFSGGMRQRIMIALVLVLRPAVVVADEPTTALDVLVEAQILELIADLQRELEMSVLLITHNLAIVSEVADRVAVMYAGRIVEEGAAAQVINQPAHPYTRALLASTISLSTRALQSIPGAPPDLVAPPGGCRFHPRCPNTMQVCTDKFPKPVQLEGGQRVECWLHGPFEQIPVGGDRRIEREEAAIADEA
jgi:oligopeptide/dipeptide ABC transporter ATP-binding protein